MFILTLNILDEFINSDWSRAAFQNVLMSTHLLREHNSQLMFVLVHFQLHPHTCCLTDLNEVNICVCGNIQNMKPTFIVFISLKSKVPFQYYLRENEKENESIVMLHNMSCKKCSKDKRFIRRS